MLSTETEPFYVFFCLASFLVPHGSALYAMQFYRFLTFFYGSIEIAFSYLTTCFIAYGIERNHLSEVILIAVFFFK